MLERIAMCHLRHFESPSVRWQNPKNLGLKYDAVNARQTNKMYSQLKGRALRNRRRRGGNRHYKLFYIVLQ